MSRRSVWMTLLCAFVLAVSFPVMGQVDRSAYRQSTFEDMLGEHGLGASQSGRAALDSILLTPSFKYRVRVKATGRVREMTSDTASALGVWSQTHPGLPAFLKEYTHEVEIVADGHPLWLIWQRSLVSPFEAERGTGGDIDAYVILAGAVQGRPVVLVTAFESLAGR